MKKIRCTLMLVLAIACLTTSCVSSKELVYFQDLNGATAATLPKPYAPTINAGDVLSIQVSSLSPEASAFFNPYAVQQAMASPTPMSSPINPLQATPGYLVATDGTITMPMIGAINVLGKTNVAVAALLREKLKTYLKEPTVSVRNQNFRITVLGEVARPSMFTISNEQITLPEAIGLAGDLTIYGKRTNVLIVREENGQRTYTRLDLTKRDVLQSPYYHLHPNDVIYVEPGKARVASTDRVYQIIPIILSGLSVLAIILTR